MQQHKQPWSFHIHCYPMLLPCKSDCLVKYRGVTDSHDLVGIWSKSDDACGFFGFFFEEDVIFFLVEFE